MVENKAKAFYNENYSNEKEKTDKKINVVIFTNKIRKDISRRNSLTNLTKTTIKNKSITNKSSRSIATIEKIYNELNCQRINKNNNLNSKSEDKLNKINFNNSQINSRKKGIGNLPPKNAILFKKIDINNNTDNNRSNNNIYKFSQSNSKNKIQMIRNMQSKIIDNKTSIISNKKNVIKVPILKSLEKINTKGNQFKNIILQCTLNNLNLNDKKASPARKNIKVSSAKMQTQNKEIINKFSNNNNSINKLKANIILINNNNKINNNNTIKVKNKNCLENIKFPHAITGSNNNINNLSANHKIIPKRAIQVIKKPQAKKEKSRNYMSIKDVNTINIDARIHINEYNPNYYFTTNDKNINLLSNKLQTAQNSKKKSQKIIRTEKKNNVIKKINKNVQNSNLKLFSHVNTTKKTINCLENTEGRISKTSLSPSLKNLILKTKGIANLRKNKINNNTINKHTYKNSYISSDSQKLVKNLKIGNS
jgi:hypothetical protein